MFQVRYFANAPTANRTTIYYTICQLLERVDISLEILARCNTKKLDPSNMSMHLHMSNRYPKWPWLTDYRSLALRYNIENTHVHARSELCACFRTAKNRFLMSDCVHHMRILPSGPPKLLHHIRVLEQMRSRSERSN